MEKSAGGKSIPRNFCYIYTASLICKYIIKASLFLQK